MADNVVSFFTLVTLLNYLGVDTHECLAMRRIDSDSYWYSVAHRRLRLTTKFDHTTLLFVLLRPASAVNLNHISVHNSCKTRVYTFSAISTYSRHRGSNKTVLRHTRTLQRRIAGTIYCRLCWLYGE